MVLCHVAQRHDSLTEREPQQIQSFTSIFVFCYRTLIFFPNNMVCMCWLHQKNFKQPSISPLRPHLCTSMCVRTDTHAYTHTLTFPAQTHPTPLSFCLCRPLLLLSLCWFTHGRLSIKARLALSVLGVDLCAGSNTPRQNDSRGYHIFPTFYCLATCAWANGRIQLHIINAGCSYKNLFED